VRLLGRLLRRRPPPPPDLDPHDPSLTLCVTAYEAARADSEVLAEAAGRGVDLEEPVLVRHHLVALPDAEAVEQARTALAAEGWAVLPGPAEAAPLALLACRTEVVTTMSASRERSRMAGLAQRLGGDVGGWDALRPPPPG
jgi:hypothetical protein